MEKVNIKWTFCHRKPERSFFWKGKQFPVCARCTGIYVGYLSLPFFSFNLLYLNVWYSILLVSFTSLDGITQALFKRESNNTIRFITGILAGVGLMSLSAILGKFIASCIININLN